MSVQMLGRCGIALFFAALAAGCSSGGGGSSSGTVSRLFNQCTWSPSSCQYEGKYEPGEEEYAEEDATRLNQAQSAKLRSRSSDCSQARAVTTRLPRRTCRPTKRPSATVPRHRAPSRHRWAAPAPHGVAPGPGGGPHI